MNLATSIDTGAMASDWATMTRVSSSEAGVEDAVRQRDVAAEEDAFDRCGAAACRPAGTPSHRRPAGRAATACAAGQRMAAPHDQAGLLDADHAALEQPRIEVVGDAGDDEIVARGEQLARQHVAGFDLDVDLDARIAARGSRGSPAPPARSPARSPSRERPSRPCRSSGRRSRGRPRAFRAASCGPGAPAPGRPASARCRAAAVRRARTPRMSSISAIMREAAGCEMLRTCAAALTLAVLVERGDQAHMAELQPAAQQAVAVDLPARSADRSQFMPASMVRCRSSPTGRSRPSDHISISVISNVGKRI